MEQDSPLSIVQHTLQVYTDRNPATTEAVADMAAAALAGMGEEGVELAERVASGLDPHNTTRFGLAGAAALHSLAENAFGPQASNEERWGALALLGVLTTAYDAGEVTPEGTAHTITTVANEVLWKVRHHAEDMNVRDFADQMLNGKVRPAYDVAVELLELPAKVAERVNDAAIEEPVIIHNNETNTYIDDARMMGEPVQMTREALGLQEDAFKGMTWLENENVADYTVRPVLRRGQTVAYAIDLIPFNKQLSKIAQSVEAQSVILARTHNRLGATIGKYARGEAVPSVNYNDTNTMHLYSKNMGSNGALTRGFFTPLGKSPDGLPLVGVTSLAFKKDEASVISILSGVKRSLIRGVK